MSAWLTTLAFLQQNAETWLARMLVIVPRAMNRSHKMSAEVLELRLKSC